MSRLKNSIKCNPEITIFDFLEEAESRIQSVRKLNHTPCRECGSVFSPAAEDPTTCDVCKEKLIKLKEESKKKNSCVECGAKFQSLHRTSRCGSCHSVMMASRAQKKEAINNGTEGVDFITCPVCSQKVEEITHRHVVMHGFPSIKDFKEHFDLPHNKCKNKRDKFVGDKNPGFQHGGKFSPFSKKFVAYKDLSEDEKAKATSEMSKQAQASTKENCGYNSTLEYYIKRGMTEDEAKIALNERQQTFSLKICIEKHGEVDGRLIWQERQDKWQKTLTSKPQEEIDRINALKSTRVNYATLWNMSLDTPGSFYLIQVSPTQLKIGITSKDLIRQRYPEVIPESVVYFEKQKDINTAFMIEQVIKRWYMTKIKRDDYGPYGWTEVLNDVETSAILEEVKYLSQNHSILSDLFEELKASNNRISSNAQI